MTTPTNAVTRAIVEYLTFRGAYVWRNNVGMLRDKNERPVRYGLVGSSDIIGVLPGGKLLACEVKTGRDRLRPSQEAFRDAIQARGGVYVVCREQDWQEQLDGVLEVTA